MSAPRVAIAPDKFRGALDARTAAGAIARGVRAARADAECVLRPMADGGEGTVDAFLASGWRAVAARAHDALGRPCDGRFAMLGERAVVEVAEASGLHRLAAAERDAARASSYGTGELVRAALDAGARELVLALGGSATTDGGTGLLAALGARFEAGDGSTLPPGGGALARLARIDLAGLDPRLRGARVVAAADVGAPLLGPRGAAHAFARQKGADDGEVALLERALGRLADVAALLEPRGAAHGSAPRDAPGAGAAGGIGFAALAMLGATFEAGAAVVARTIGLAAALEGAALAFTGEGRLDAQTLEGKTVRQVARLARLARVPCVALCGSLEPAAAETLEREDRMATFAIGAGPSSLAAALAETEASLERTARTVASLLVGPSGGDRAAG